MHARRCQLRGSMLTIAAVVAVSAAPSGYSIDERMYGGHYCHCGCCWIAWEQEREHARLGRSSQITTMVARFKQLRPNGAAPIVLRDGAIYAPKDLEALVAAGYCADADLVDERGGNWIWKESMRRFEPME